MSQPAGFRIGPQSTAMVRSLGLLYIAGPTIAVACNLLPRSSATDETAIWIMIVIAYSMAPVLFTQYRRLRPAAVSAIILLANTLITAAVYFDHEASSYYAFFYVWGTPYAAIFFGNRHMLAHLAYPAAAYAVVLAIHAGDAGNAPGNAEVGFWLHAVAAMAVTALLVRSLVSAVVETREQEEADRRRRALEINDDVVQRLIVARAAYAAGDDADGEACVGAALERARSIMADLVGTDRVEPGSLRRDRAATDDA